MKKMAKSAVACILATGLVACGGGSGDGGEPAVSAANGNPGTVPSPILAEHTAINLFELGANLGGHKFFAGPLGSDPDTPEYYTYVNLDFKCDNTGVYEAHAPRHNEKASSTFEWREADSLTFGYQVEPNDPDFVFWGDPFDTFYPSITMSEVDGGDVIVGTGEIEHLVITRIVQYEDCGK